MSFLKVLKFDASKIAIEGDKKVLEFFLKGKFKRDDIVKQINILGKEFNSSDIQLGVAMHYKSPSKWARALMSYTNGPFAVWNPIDSPDTKDAYDGEIDAIHVFVIEHKPNKAADAILKKPIVEYRMPKEKEKASKYFN